MNIVDLIQEQNKTTPDKKAVVFPYKYKNNHYKYKYLSYFQLEQKSNLLARKLQKKKIMKGHKVLVFIKPSLEFSVIIFALFKIGAIPIFLDPGIGIKNVLNAIKKAKPDVLIAVPIVHLFKIFLPKLFKSTKVSLTTKKLWFFPNIISIHSLINSEETLSLSHFECTKCTKDDIAAIVFTSGGTGKPKGVTYTHKMFYSQIKLQKEIFKFNSNDIDLPGFPLFSLMTIAMGVTSVIPDMNPSIPSKADPKKIVQNILDNNVTTAAGSPAIWERVGQYCKDKKIELKSIRALIMFGAPIRHHLHELFKQSLPNGNTFTPYGATECLPVSNISGTEILNLPQAQGPTATCIGKTFPNTRLRIIKYEQEAIETIEKCEFLAPYEIGEIIVQGEQASPFYFFEKKQTIFAKINDPKNKTFWHRMGDYGYLDNNNKLWFCGRVSHKVDSTCGVFYSIPTESIFNRHPNISKAALVSIEVNRQIYPAIVIERKDHKTKLHENIKNQFKKELIQLSSCSTLTRKIEYFFLHSNLPVDKRHNIKIDRIALSNFFMHRSKEAL